MIEVASTQLVKALPYLTWLTPNGMAVKLARVDSATRVSVDAWQNISVLRKNETAGIVIILRHLHHYYCSAALIQSVNPHFCTSIC